MAVPPIRYAALPADWLRVEPLDGLTAIYHRPSGLTHIVSDPVPVLIAALAEGSDDAAGLTRRLAQRFALGVAGGESKAAVVAAHLAEMEQLGLIAHDG